jgi:ribonuclease P protein component
MLPKANRLTKKKDFDVVFRGGKTVRGDFLMAKVLESQLPASRFGFVVSKKVSSKATVRNKVKRRLRDAVGDLIAGKKPVDVVLVALTGIDKQDFAQLQNTVKAMFKKYV